MDTSGHYRAMVTYDEHGVKYTRDRDTLFTEPVHILWETISSVRRVRPLRGDFWIYVRPGTDVEPLVKGWSKNEPDTTYEVEELSDE